LTARLAQGDSIHRIGDWGAKSLAITGLAHMWNGPIGKGFHEF
jgi:hypothetical protein